MQVTETQADGLKRAYSVTVSAADLAERTAEKLEGVRKDFQMKGFRKGKAPLPLLKKMFGKSVMGEVVQETVEQTLSKHLEDAGHRPAQQPDVKIANEKFDEGDDLVVEIAYEMLPEIPETDFSSLQLERRVVTVDDTAVEEALGKLAEGSTDYAARDEGAASEDGDQVVIDFTGRIDGEAFEGGAAEDYPLVLGAGSFIPGFEPQIVGKTPGETFDVTVTFPEDYNAAHLAGKEAIFEVVLKETRAPSPAEVNDALATRYGAEDLDQLRGQIRERIEAEYSGAARTLLKRRLLDALDETVSFEVPASLVEAEAKAIADQLWHEENPEVEGHDHPEIEATEEHTSLAVRRVKLGLLLAELGRAGNVEISDAELGQAIMSQAQNYPGQEREFFEYVRQNRPMLEQIRAPLFEDKVVDMIVAEAAVTDVPVDKDALQAELEALDSE